MIKGAFIFAAGAVVGLVVGYPNGFILGYRVSDTINKNAAAGEQVTPEAPETVVNGTPAGLKPEAGV